MGDKITVTRTFECDKKMIPIIKELWDKGYTTSGCCEGHTVTSNIDGDTYLSPCYISFYGITEIITNPQGYGISPRFEVPRGFELITPSKHFWVLREKEDYNEDISPVEVLSEWVNTVKRIPSGW